MFLYAGYSNSLASSAEGMQCCSIKCNHLISLFLLKIFEFYTLNLNVLLKASFQNFLFFLKSQEKCCLSASMLMAICDIKK